MNDIERRLHETALYIARAAADISPYITFTEDGEDVTVTVNVEDIRLTGSHIYAHRWISREGGFFFEFEDIRFEDGEWRSDRAGFDVFNGDDIALADYLNDIEEIVEFLSIGGRGEEARDLRTAFRLAWDPRGALGRRYHARFAARTEGES